LSAGGRAALDAALAECGRHAQVLADAAALLPEVFSPEAASAIDVELWRVLDQAAYRYVKLQDSLDEKVFPGLLSATLDPLPPPDAVLAEKLQRLERIGVLPSVQGSRWLREVRNSLAHEYPESPALRAAALTRFVEGARLLLLFWGSVQQFVATRLL
jgi:hypothetical protein